LPLNTSTTWPRRNSETGNVEYNPVLTGAADASYRSQEVEMRCRYWLESSMTDYFQFRITTAPVFELRSDSSLSPNDWLGKHILPLRELVALATLEPQSIAWVMVDEAYEPPTGMVTTRDYQLYSETITQSPYAPNA